MCSCKPSLPKLSGRVIVLGAGDTAFDCATSSLRCGASKVFVCFRRGFTNIRAVPEEVELARDEKCEFIPFVIPIRVLEKNGRIYGLEFARTELDDNGKLIIDNEQTMTIKAGTIISAFGSCLSSEDLQSLSIETSNNLPLVDKALLTTNQPWIFCGGDAAGVASTTVEAVNDGKTAAWSMHKYLQVR